MMKNRLVVLVIFSALALFCFGCASTLPTHTYWRKNSTTEMYSVHQTYSALSADEIQELNLISELPPDAKVID